MSPGSCQIYLIFFRQDRAKAVEILVKDLKVFASFNEDLFKEITQLLTLDNFRLYSSFIVEFTIQPLFIFIIYMEIHF